MPSTTFESLGLSRACLAALSHEGYTVPTPIQEATIPSLLEGRDLLGCAQTGTGKTAAFALPTIQILAATPQKRQPRKARALVVAPTRELAMQIDASFAAYGRGSELKRACVYGGVGKMPQIKAMERGVDVLVATPGRLLDLKSEGYIDLSAVEIVVLDEADRMLDMGFIHDVRKIIALLPKKRQTLLFSATMPSEIEELARSMLDNPVRITIEPEKPTIELISQSLYHVEKGAKRDLLVHLLRETGATRTVVFSRTKHGADKIARALNHEGLNAGVIHANKGQGNRTRTMEAFRSGETPVLVATDLAARGIDVDDISHVFNYDLPTEPETYIHRIGRTARAGASGTAITFCDIEEKRQLKMIEKLLGKPIPVVHAHPFAGVHVRSADDDEADREPRGNRSAGRQGSGARAGNRSGQKPAGRFAARSDSAPRGGAPAAGVNRNENRNGRTGAGNGGRSGDRAEARGGTRTDGRSGNRAGGTRQEGQPGAGRPRSDRAASAPSGSGSGTQERQVPRQQPERRHPAPSDASGPGESRRGNVRSIIDEITGRRA